MTTTKQTNLRANEKMMMKKKKKKKKGEEESEWRVRKRALRGIGGGVAGGSNSDRCGEPVRTEQLAGGGVVSDRPNWPAGAMLRARGVGSRDSVWRLRRKRRKCERDDDDEAERAKRIAKEKEK